MSNFGFISKKKVAREIAKIYNEHKSANLFDSGACSSLNFLCTKLKIKPMHRNKLGGGTGEILNIDRCVCCGEIIPEGRQVCPNCEKKVMKDVEFDHKNKTTLL